MKYNKKFISASPLYFLFSPKLDCLLSSLRIPEDVRMHICVGVCTCIGCACIYIVD